MERDKRERARERGGKMVTWRDHRDKREMREREKERKNVRQIYLDERKNEIY